MLRANLAAARKEAPTEGLPAGAEAGEEQLREVREELEAARKRVGELHETGELFKEQQVAAVQAAAGAQKQVNFRMTYV